MISLATAGTTSGDASAVINPGQVGGYAYVGGTYHAFTWTVGATVVGTDLGISIRMEWEA